MSTQNFFYFSSSISNSSSEDEEEMYDYQIMEFIKRGRKPVNRMVRIVIKPWIKVTAGKIKVQYMEESHNEEDKLLIRNLILMMSPAPEDWPWFTVVPVGHGSTYIINYFAIQR